MLQYTVVVERPVDKNSKQLPFFFSNFDDKKKVISFVSQMNEGLKVYKIIELDTEGMVENMTIGFKNGVLDLIYI